LRILHKHFMKPILEIKNLSKKYRIQHLEGGYLSLRERMVSALKFQRNETEDFWALKGVSFEVQVGESIGIIGRNGAGKSTLLKILSKITPPTSGKIISRGRIASLLEVGTGFHPELTGRENIFFNGSLLGMKRMEIAAKFDEIIDFSGVEKFLDTPLKHYSSGMQLRLAFAVAAFLEPEILIIDEVLAVGDAEFQKKCLGKMEDVSKSGRTILFVSHNMAAVSNLCKYAILLDKGQLKLIGFVDEIISAYQQSFSEQVATLWKSTSKDKIYFSFFSLELKYSQPKHALEIKFGLVSNELHPKTFVAFDIINSIGVAIMQAIPNPEPFIEYSDSEQTFALTIELPPLIPDYYKVSAWVGSHNMETLSWQKEIVGFEIIDSPQAGRSFPHSHANGFIIPHSKLTNG
jgi:lipopolysaccharide transport system ATP-binding protein